MTSMTPHHSQGHVQGCFLPCESPVWDEPQRRTLASTLWASVGKAWDHVTASFLGIFLQRWMTSMHAFSVLFIIISLQKKDCRLERSKLRIIPDLCSQTFIYCLLINYYMYSFLLLDLPRFVRLYLSDAISQW